MRPRRPQLPAPGGAYMALEDLLCVCFAVLTVQGRRGGGSRAGSRPWEAAVTRGAALPPARSAQRGGRRRCARSPQRPLPSLSPLVSLRSPVLGSPFEVRPSPSSGAVTRRWGLGLGWGFGRGGPSAGSSLCTRGRGATRPVCCLPGSRRAPGLGPVAVVV